MGYWVVYCVQRRRGPVGMSQSVVRMIFKDKEGSTVEIFEHGELVTPPNIALLMRRSYVSRAISEALSAGGTVTIEVRK
jgi:hypothetical protein